MDLLQTMSLAHLCQVYLRTTAIAIAVVVTVPVTVVVVALKSLLRLLPLHASASLSQAEQNVFLGSRHMAERSIEKKLESLQPHPKFSGRIISEADDSLTLLADNCIAEIPRRYI